MEVRNRKATATRENVFKACDELLACGEYPTQALIRKHLGAGSFTSINKYQQEWRNERENDGTSYTAMFPAKPKEVQQALDSAYAEMYKHVEKNIVNEQVATLDAENEQLRNQLEEMEKKLMGYEETKGKVEAHENHIDRLLKDNAKLQQEVGQLTEAFKRIEPR